MGRDLAENFPESRAIFDAADGALGFAITKLCFDGPEEELKLTENTQPAILTVSTAAYRALEKRGIAPDFVAGHSLGEYSALVAAGSLDFADAVKIVRNRGRYMQEAVPPGEGAMAAIMGLPPGEVTDLCKQAADQEVVTPANLNSPERGCGKARRGNCIAKRREARGDAAGVGTISFAANGTRATPAGTRFTRGGIRSLALPAHYQCRCRSDQLRRRSA